MNGLIRLLLIVAMVGLFTNCSSAPTGEDGVPVEDGASADGYAQEGTEGAPPEEVPADPNAPQEFAEGGEDQPQQFAEGGDQSGPPPESAPMGDDFAAQGGIQEAPPADAGAVPPPPEASVAQQEEFNPPPPESDQFGGQPPMDQGAPPPMDQGNMPPPADLPPMEQQPPPMVDLGPPPSENLAPAPLPPAEPETATNAPLSPPETFAPESPASSGATASAKITDIRYKSNSNGGTILVESNAPVQYTTRVNEENNQFILEIADVSLPRKLQRPFNTKDFGGAIGAIDAYQAKGSNTARVVVQIRDGFPMPKVEQEAMSIMVIAQAKGAITEGSADTASSGDSGESAESAEPEQEFEDAKILPGKNLDEFISGNTQFFGKKISIEVTDMDLRDVLRMITEETGINMILDDEVKGVISLKLKQVPWDQALVVIMKAKKLGYTRQGSVLRIAPIRDLRTEEEEATRVASSRKTQEPLRVKMIPVSYAKIEDIAKQVQQFLGEKGRVVGDSRTSALVITDIEENINKAAKLVESLDVPPYQVLIEGKIVEARDSFTRSIGVNWGASGKTVNLAGSGAKAITLNQSMSGTPTSLGAGAFNLNLSIGTLDILGDLSATLALKEREEAVKVISSPRIVTLHNEVAEINQSTEIPLISTVNANGTTTTSVSFKPVRLKLNVIPQITTEGGVIMSVDVAREFVGAVVDEQSQAAPVNARSAKTKVLVHNGQTAVIGGIYQSDAAESESGIPWLRHMPILGHFFKGSNKSKDKSELLIFLTPRILGQIDHGTKGTGGM